MTCNPDYLRLDNKMGMVNPTIVHHDKKKKTYLCGMFV